MSAFYVTCPACGERYFHLFIGTQLLSGHRCPKASPYRPAECEPSDQRSIATPHEWGGLR